MIECCIYVRVNGWSVDKVEKVEGFPYSLPKLG